MKSTGYVRQVDQIGRIVLPKYLRDNLKTELKQQLEIYTEGNEIYLQKYKTKCRFCGSNNIKRVFKNIPICYECAAGLNNFNKNKTGIFKIAK